MSKQFSSISVAARAAASIMAMNNIYYRFTHLASAPDYKTLPARLRMNVIGKPGVDKADFELWCLAVSAINGCGVCIDSHEKILRDANYTANIRWSKALDVSGACGQLAGQYRKKLEDGRRVVVDRE